MHDLLFRNQLNLTDADLTRYAEELGISAWADVDRHRERVDADLAAGQRNGVRGTPSFFINGVRHRGSHDLKSFRTAIDAELDRLGVSL
jgi:protein-disulfide isomerase